MKILITNDDGVDAEGIRVLAELLKSQHEVIIIAPSEERSTTGHSLTLDKPLRLKELEKNLYSCSGFPADCVLIGLSKVLDKRPDLVISGINRGGNLGQDIYYSGTVAGAREAAFHGVPSIAVSTVIDFENPTGPFNYLTAAKATLTLINSGLVSKLPERAHFNLNVPDCMTQELLGFKFSQLGIRSYSEDITQRKDMRGEYYYWVGGYYKGFEPIPGSDCQNVDQKYASISILNFKGPLTDKECEWAHEIDNLKI
ncbi:MAG: 5'/3'-nucleotidase SurE [Halobacteriovoraceae bacterium]|jgi:5'-nucleotidase|nr:5'/3'-nucleotidase SurE [Halobacteriovoraceae bacterium]